MQLSPALRATIARAGLDDIASRVLAGERLGLEEGLRLSRAPLLALGILANVVREHLHGDRAYFNVNQHINYTNLCNHVCLFCAFARKPGEEGGYLMSPEDVAARVRERLEEPITEVHMVAGVYKKLPYAYYLDILRAVKSVRPDVHIKAFTMVELAEILRVARKPAEDVFAELQEAGLGSLPGGGIEVLSDRVHDRLFRSKLGPRDWLDMARRAHRAGLRSNATLLYGHLETDEERVRHLIDLRALQDETGGFGTFIPLSFHPANTDLEALLPPTGQLDLRCLALGRLMLDNFAHIKSFWIMQTLPISQIALHYGADDVDGTVTMERITHAAGAETPLSLTRAELVRLIREASRVPVERDTLGNVVREG